MIEDRPTRLALMAHVQKLARLACNCEDEDRRLDAIRSLGAMALLIGPKGGDGDGDGEAVAAAVIAEVISLADFAKAA